MLEFNEEPRRLVSTFLSYRNDIDLYTEDELKDKEFYKALFTRLLRHDIKINDITPLGSKDAVINRCKNEPDNGRKKLFIVDGDVNIVHGRIPNEKGLFVLDAYCIENMLIDKDTVIQFLYLSCGTRSKEDICDQLSYDNWLTGYTEALINLFIHFAIVDFFGGKFRLFNAYKFHIKNGDEYCFSTELISTEVENIKMEILLLTSEENYSTKLAELSSAWPSKISNLLTIVSGKDYLIPILLIKSQLLKKSKALGSLEEIKLGIVQYSNLARLEKLKTVIESL